MRASKAWTWALTAAGLLQVTMGIVHFGLPTMFGWSDVDFPPLLQWALLTLNFSWSALVVANGGLIVYSGRLGPHGAFVRLVVLMVGLFWAIHGVYVVVEPMPVPPRLGWIQAPIVAFPATLVLLHGIALLATNSTAARGTVPV